MATDPKDFDALLAEVERSLEGGRGQPASTPGTPVRRGGSAAPVEESGGTGGGSLVRRTVAVPLLLAAVVGVLFFLLPFLSGFSGAAGAFLGALVAGILARWLR